MNLERIATLSASGLTDAQIATIVGLSPGRISQIKKESEFQDLLTAKSLEIEKKDIEEVSLSAKYTAVEHLLLDQITQLAPVAELRDVTAALRAVAERQDKAKTRINPMIQGAPVINNIVQLTLPSHAAPEIVLNAEQEVIAIGSRNLAPLSSSGVVDLFRNISKQGNADHEQASLPGSSEADAPKALPFAESAKITAFLDSLHPAPFAKAF